MAMIERTMASSFQPRHQVHAPQRGPQARADLSQERVSGVVSERVVDVLEVVEVDQQQGQRRVVRRAAARHP